MDKSILLQPKAGEPTAESVLRELVRRHDTSTVEALYPELLAIWEAARKVLAAPPVGMVSEPTDDLRARLDDALFVLGMVNKNNRIDEGENLKAWSGDFVVKEVRRVLAGTPPADQQPYAFEYAILIQDSWPGWETRITHHLPKHSELRDIKPLFDTPATPSGMVSVPLEPTEEMLNAALKSWDGCDNQREEIKAEWRAMLEAAPK